MVKITGSHLSHCGQVKTRTHPKNGLRGLQGVSDSGGNSLGDRTDEEHFNRRQLEGSGKK